MWVKRICWMILTFALLFCSIASPASATEINSPHLQYDEGDMITPLATNSFSMHIQARTNAQANMSFLLMTGETVTIKASYATFDASVDFGLVDEDGTFYYFNVTTGNIDKTIIISKSGNYTLQIRNNSTGEIEVSGFVNY